ncbi:DUF4124 domain-containing protein [Thalassotalea euphylliae]|uniref:DUF4124 domain-containing protein n=1 Tax=Thalassotalea euphylliae TaxID=1655234 RepID=A0A3E0UKL6_9GAMM|nr:DUF4124 domain-containing protein [Thalassotalea euphylliae]REL36282.1 DUF4124 domain-containing protein [Thalassotalea euphylliae]
MLKITIILSLLVIAPWQVNAQIYKWVDKDGNTHFSQTPPPDLNEEMEELKIGVQPQKTGQSSVDTHLDGAWWSMTSKGVRTLFLRDNGLFNIHQWSARHGQLDTLFSGRWREEGKEIILTYTRDSKNPQNSAMVGVSEKLTVSSLSHTRMSVIDPDNRTQQYLRVNGDKFAKSYHKELMMGDWYDTKGKRLELSWGEFKVAEHNHSKSLAEGNWDLINGELTLEYVFDFVKYPQGKIGAKQSWRVETLDENKMILRHAHNPILWHFTKKS